MAIDILRNDQCGFCNVLIDSCMPSLQFIQNALLNFIRGAAAVSSVTCKLNFSSQPIHHHAIEVN